MTLKDDLYSKIDQYFESHNDFDNEHFYQQVISIMDDLKERIYDKHQDLIDLFFLHHHFYYITTTDLYIKYVDKSFTIINENDLIHIILSFLSKHRETYSLNTQLKNRIQQKIQKQIKEKDIYNIIPESETLQNILSFFHPNLFISRNHSKYFLTIIGDIILKKTKCIYFIKGFMKGFIQKLNKYIHLYFNNTQLFNNFKFKYSDHDQSISRIISMNPLNMSYFNLEDSFFINMICVCIHYSNRYISSEHFLNQMDDNKDILWIQQNSKENMVKLFLDKYIIPKPTCVIDEKDMLFLWKSYLMNENKLNIFQKNQDLYDVVGTIITYDKNYFWNISSMYLPYVENFKDFWNKYIYEDNNEFEFEINELFYIYKKQYKCKIDETTFRELIEYYYPNQTIYDDKYIYHIGCTLWNKKKELETYMDKNKHIEEVYQDYCNDFKTNHKVSKRYFTKFYSHYFNIDTNII